jgi:ABC-type multidrug transport system ATPase subunit
VFDLFDNVILMDCGHITYQGPKEKIRPYFENLGYVCPPRKDLADFLQEVPTHMGREYISRTTSSDGIDAVSNRSNLINP